MGEVVFHAAYWLRMDAHSDWRTAVRSCCLLQMSAQPCF